MGDVAVPGYWDADIWRMQDHREPEGHTEGVQTGRFGQSITCRKCGTICTPRFEPMVLTNIETGESVTIPGAYVGPPDDPVGHLFPFGMRHETPTNSSQDNTDEHLATEPATSKRPDGISAAAAAKGRSRDTPSRSPKARRAEYDRAKAKRRREAHRV